MSRFFNLKIIIPTEILGPAEPFNFSAFLKDIDSRDPDELRRELALKIASLAVVEDADTGYIVIREINQRVRPDLLWKAAVVTQKLFLKQLVPEDYPQLVVGVSNRGKEFATVLSLLLGLPLSVSDRRPEGIIESADSIGPSAVNLDPLNGLVTISNVPSFTQKISYTHILRGVNPEKDTNILVADDFCAYGEITRNFRQALIQLGIRLTFVYLIAKDFPFLSKPQTGYRDILAQNIPAFAVVSLIGIENGKVIATAEDINV